MRTNSAVPVAVEPVGGTSAAPVSVAWYVATPLLSLFVPPGPTVLSEPPQPASNVADASNNIANDFIFIGTFSSLVCVAAATAGRPRPWGAASASTRPALGSRRDRAPVATPRPLECAMHANV